METQEEYITIDLKKILFLFWHNILLILFSAAICAVIGFLYARFIITPLYSASADMLVNNTQDVTITTITSADLVASSNLVGTYSIILKSHNVLEKVIEDLNLNMTYEALSSQVTVKAVDDTQVMRITVINPSSAVAMKIVSRIVDLAPDIIIDTVNAGSVKMVDTPWTTQQPVSPNQKKYAAIAGVLGLVICVVFILIKEMLSNTFRTQEDVRRILDLPVLGIIPQEDGFKQSRREKRSET